MGKSVDSKRGCGLRKIVPLDSVALIYLVQYLEIRKTA
jgi:hypothetical protein